MPAEASSLSSRFNRAAIGSEPPLGGNSRPEQENAKKWQAIGSAPMADLPDSLSMKNLSRRFALPLASLLVGVASLPPCPAEAGARRFTYVYEATTSAPGSIESENWITWGTRMRDDRNFNKVDFRHEIEVGITEHFQASLYLADWSYLDSPAEGRPGFSYDASALELIYNLTNPTTSFLGSAIYEEVRLGPEIIELESKLILQKNIGPVVIAYNATLEAKWEGPDRSERTGEFAQSVGVSYEVSPSLSVGGELLHEVDLPDWRAAKDSIVYGGPDVSYRHGHWWVTITPLLQLTEISSEVDFQTRAIVGFSF
ncbi:MAG: hypothetical protein ACR2HH_06430 [Chthoniobacterales bacterium]